MLVFSTLSRLVIEDRWVGERYGARAQPLLDEHRALETRIWTYSRVLLSEAQTDELRSSIEAWHRENPLGRAVPFIHLEDFAFATSATRPGGASSNSIFSFLGIDPLSNLDRRCANSRSRASLPSGRSITASVRPSSSAWKRSGWRSSSPWPRSPCV